MLKLQPDPTFTSKVDIPTPNGVVTIKMVYRHMTRDAFAAFVQAETDMVPKRTDEDAIMDIATGWFDVDAEFNRESVAKLCQEYHAAPGAIVRTFFAQLTQAKKEN